MGPDRPRRAAALTVLATATIAALLATSASRVAAQQQATDDDVQLAPELQLAPETVDFGRVAVDGRGQRMLTVTNVGGGELIVSAVTVAGDDPDMFAAGAGDCLNTALAGGESCEVTVGFQPTTPGTRQAVVEIDASDADSPHRAVLTGTTQPPGRAWPSWLVGALGALGTLTIVIGKWAHGKTRRWVATHVRVEPHTASPDVTVAPLEWDASPTVRIVVRRDTGTQTVHEVTR